MRPGVTQPVPSLFAASTSTTPPRNAVHRSCTSSPLPAPLGDAPSLEQRPRSAPPCLISTRDPLPSASASPPVCLTEQNLFDALYEAIQILEQPFSAFIECLWGTVENSYREIEKKQIEAQEIEKEEVPSEQCERLAFIQGLLLKHWESLEKKKRDDLYSFLRAYRSMFLFMLSFLEESYTSAKLQLLLVLLQKINAGDWDERNRILTKTIAVINHFYKWFQWVFVYLCQFLFEGASSEVDGAPSEGWIGQDVDLILEKLKNTDIVKQDFYEIAVFRKDSLLTERLSADFVGAEILLSRHFVCSHCSPEVTERYDRFLQEGPEEEAAAQEDPEEEQPTVRRGRSLPPLGSVGSRRGASSLTNLFKSLTRRLSSASRYRWTTGGVVAGVLIGIVIIGTLIGVNVLTFGAATPATIGIILALEVGCVSSFAGVGFAVDCYANDNRPVQPIEAPPPLRSTATVHESLRAAVGSPANCSPKKEEEPAVRQPQAAVAVALDPYSRDSTTSVDRSSQDSRRSQASTQGGVPSRDSQDLSEEGVESLPAGGSQDPYTKGGLEEVFDAAPGQDSSIERSVPTAIPGARSAAFSLLHAGMWKQQKSEDNDGGMNKKGFEKEKRGILCTSRPGQSPSESVQV